MTRHILKATINKYCNRNNSYKSHAAQLNVMIILTEVQWVQKFSLLLLIFFPTEKSFKKIHICSFSIFRMLPLFQY